MKGEWLRKPKNEATIVWLHGINSSAQDAWKDDDGKFWPTIVSEDDKLNHYGNYVFDYYTSIFSANFSISDVADNLRDYLKTDEVINSRQIIFVCHSMGGIVARKYLIDNIAIILTKKIKIGLFLIASPSLGSKYANFFEHILKLLNNSQALSLRFFTDNPWLNELNKNFKTMKDNPQIEIVGKELIEDKFAVLKRRFWFNEVVPAYSGNAFFGEPSKIPKSDHNSISKVSCQDEYQHKLLRDFITDNFKRLEDTIQSELNRRNYSTVVATSVYQSGNYTAIIGEENDGNILIYKLKNNDEYLTYSQVLNLLLTNDKFLRFYNRIFQNCKFETFVWETIPVSLSTLERHFEFVFINNPSPSSNPNRTKYEKYFNTDNGKEGIVSFWNLGRDTWLIVPSPYRDEDDFSNLSSFYKYSSEQQQLSLWKITSKEISQRMTNRSLWVSVAGGGIAWLHIRLDPRPKYYRYDRYRKMN